MSKNQSSFIRVNNQIRVPKVRLIRNGENLGIVDTNIAKKMAMDMGLDLVEVSATSKPPVCSIIDYGKYKYNQQKKEKKKTSAVVKIKEIKLTPVIGDSDLNVKVNKIKELVSEGNKVKITLRFKKRQHAHKDVGFDVIKNFLEKLDPFVSIDMPPRLEGGAIRCRVEPKKG